MDITKNCDPYHLLIERTIYTKLLVVPIELWYFMCGKSISATIMLLYYLYQ